MIFFFLAPDSLYEGKQIKEINLCPLKKDLRIRCCITKTTILLVNTVFVLAASSPQSEAFLKGFTLSCSSCLDEVSQVEASGSSQVLGFRSP